VYFTDKVGMDFDTASDILETVFLNGTIVKEVTLADIRNRNK